MIIYLPGCWIERTYCLQTLKGNSFGCIPSLTTTWKKTIKVIKAILGKFPKPIKTTRIGKNTTLGKG